MKKRIGATLIGVAMLMVATAAPALASRSGDGSDYGTQPGYGTSTGQTSCADHGSFDAFGKNASLGTQKVHATFLGSYPGPGTDGQQTGANNSQLCGNPQN